MAAPRISSADLRRAAFAANYLVNGGNGTQAAIDAGYAPKSAHVTASQLLNDPKVQEILAAAKAKVVKKAEVTLERIVEELRDILVVDIGEVIDEHGGLKPIAHWPEGARRACSGIDVSEEYGPSDDDGKIAVIGKLKKVKFWSKTDAADKLLKVLGGYAPEKHEHEVTVNTLASDLDAAHARIAAERK